MDDNGWLRVIASGFGIEAEKVALSMTHADFGFAP